MIFGKSPCRFKVDPQMALMEEYNDFDTALKRAVQDSAAAANELSLRHEIKSNMFTVDLQQGLFGKITDAICRISTQHTTWLAGTGPVAASWADILFFFGALPSILGTPENFWEILTNVRSFGNFLIVSRIVESMADDRHARVTIDSGLSREQTKELLLHYLKYATAAYGPIQIAANIVGSVTDIIADESGKEDQASRAARLAIALYIDVLFDGILYCSKPGGSDDLINHIVVVDHKRQEVLLAIRGTYSVDGVSTDLEAKGVDYCGGKAHGGFVKRAQQLMENQYTIKAIESGLQMGLDKTGLSYKLILTGHSLGAGIACLINIALQRNPSMFKALYSKLECYGYACPPTFYSPGAQWST
jgi:Lipase (class 3)